MYEIKEYQRDMDLSFFYKRCQQKGFTNNASQKSLIGTFEKQKFYKLWVLFYNNMPVGTTAAHDFDDVMGKNSYRICVRTCVLSELLPIKHVRTKDGIINHQNIVSQIFIPIIINALPIKSGLYITSSKKDEASMRLVDSIWARLLMKQKSLKKIREVHYRGTEQTVWQLVPKIFLKNLYQHPRWQYKVAV